MSLERTIHGRIGDTYGNAYFEEGHYLYTIARYADGTEEQLGEEHSLDSPESASYALSIVLPNAEDPSVVRPDLVGVELRVYDGDYVQAAEPIARSPLVVAPQAQETIDVIVGGVVGATPRGPTEVKRIADQLAAVGLSTPGELANVNTAEKMSLLAARTGIDPRTLVLYRRAVDLASELHLATSQQELLFALGRQKLPMSPLGLALAGQTQIDQALVRAVEANIIEADNGQPPSSDALVSKLQTWLGDNTIEYLDPLMQLVGLEHDHQEIVDLYLAAADADAFWAALLAVEGIDQQGVNDLRVVMKLSVLTQRNTPLIERLWQARGGSWTALEDLAAWNSAEWLAEVYATQMPDNYEEDEEHYADELERIFEEQLPTAAMILRLAGESEPIPYATEISTYYQSHLDLDLDSGAVTTYLDANPGLGTNAATQLAAVQRLHRLAPAFKRSKAVSALIREGYTSAQAIAATTPQTFKAAMSELLTVTENDGDARALGVHRRAKQMKRLVDALAARHSAAFDATAIAAVAPAETQSVVGDLLGIEGTAGCPHDRSIFGPPAYLADLLAFLEAKPSKDAGFTRLLDRLVDRRPDLTRIALGTDNTHVLVPAIDLSNEVLEARLAQETSIGTVSNTRNTTGSSEERRAIPEHRIDALYGGTPSDPKQLNMRCDHLELPYDDAKERFNQALELLGVDRAELFECLAVTPAEQTIAVSERLGIVNESDRADIESAQTGSTVYELWGVSSLPEVSQLTTLLDATELDIDALLEVFDTPTFRKTLSYAGDDAFGDLDAASLSPTLSETEADLLRRALKLQRRCGWSFREVERAIGVLGAGMLDSALLDQMAVIEAMHQDYGVDRETLINWVNAAALDEAGDPPFVPFVDRVFPQGPPTTFDSAHQPQIAAALGIAPAELAAIGGVADATELGAAHQKVGMARALRISVEDLHTMGTSLDIQLTGPADLAEAFDRIAGLRDLGVEVAALSYLLGHTATLANEVAPATWITNLKTQLQPFWSAQADVQATRTELTRLASNEEAAAIVRSAQALLSDASVSFKTGEATTGKAVALLALTEDEAVPVAEVALADDGTYKVFDHGRAVLDVNDQPITGPYSPSDTFKLVRASGAITVKQNTTVLATIEDGGAPLVVRASLEPSTTVATTLSEIAFAGEIDDPNRRVTIDALASYGDTSAAMAEALAGGIDVTIDGVEHPLLEVLIEQLWALSVQADVDNTKAAVKRYHRVATLASKLRLDDDEAAWLLGYNESAVLDMSDSVPTSQLQATMRDLFELGAIKRRMKLESFFAPSVFPPDTEVDFAAELCASNDRLDAPVVEQLVTILGKPASVVTFRRLERAIALFAHTSMLPDTFDGIFDPIDETMATSLMDRARGVRTDQAWLELVQPINDRLRRGRRDALVRACKLEGVASTDEQLYSELLIDSQIEPCQQTSRIKSAISSVQQFIQRIFLRIEGDEEMSDGDAQLWEWMRNYRVWEANRKIFVYPENWLDPQWRDDKTPFFRELESELAQGELTEERIEQIVLAYLEKVHDVANLEVAAICAEGDTVHVIGRTRREPRAYYYRCREGETWSAWESLDVEIESEQLMLVAHNRRLYMLWPSFSETTKPVTEIDKDNPTTPVKGHAIYLCWAERRHGRWGRQQRSGSAVSLESWEKARGNGPSKSISAYFERRADGEEHTFSFLVSSDSTSGDLLVEPLRHNYFSHIESNQLAAVTLRRALRFRVRASTHEVSVELPGSEGQSSPILPGFGRSGQHLIAHRGDLALARYQPSVKAYVSVPVLDSAGSSYRVMGPATSIVPTLDTLPLVFDDGDRVYIVDRKRLPEVVQLADPGLDVGAHATSVWKSSAAAAIADGIDAFGLDVATSVVDTDSAQQVVAQLDRIDTQLPELGLLAASLKEQQNALGGTAAFVGGQAAAPMVNRVASISTIAVTGAGLLSPLLLRSGGAPPAGSHQVEIAGMAVGIPTYEQTRAIPMPDFIEPPPSPGLDLRGPSSACKLDHVRFTRMHYPHSERLLAEVNIGGIWAVYRPDADSELHRQSLSTGFNFVSAYDPQNVVNTPHETPDFRPNSATGLYNWEIFVHIPLVIAQKLRLQGDYEAARNWLHALFDPTRGGAETAPTRYWRFRPFYNLAKDGIDSESVQELLAIVGPGGDDPDTLETRRDVMAQIALWSRDPFSPHAIARLRWRAYQPAIVMAYLDTLIEWADALFRRDTMESVNEASQLYMLAAELLGRCPVELPGRELPAKSYVELDPFGGGFSNAFVTLENSVSELPSVEIVENQLNLDGPALGVNAVHTEVHSGGSSTYLYFGVPYNDRLVDLYWGRITDRLFKIHHCQNIDGVERALALFEPPIDPALLVRAKALGLSIGDALTSLSQSLPNYRFEPMLAAARTMCRDVQQLESQLLSALEKRDVEELSRLRANHEVELNGMIERIRRQAVVEAKEQRQTLKKRREALVARQQHYASLPFRNAEEKEQMSSLESANRLHWGAMGTRLGEQVARAIPSPYTGAAGWSSPVAIYKSLTELTADVLHAATTVLEASAHAEQRAAHRASIRAGQQWRKVDWDFQVASATREIAVIDQEIVVADLRLAMARYALDRHRKTVEHSKEARDFVTRKFSNFELYDWMVGELTRLHRAAYDVAYELAQKAEKCLQFDLGEPDASFVQPQLATSLKERLFAGDELAGYLRKMEAYHLDRNVRKHELTRHISLAEVAPDALLQLRSTGTCEFDLSESLFDLDVPGHYLRRIKSVALSIPSTAGPYTPIHAKLALQRSRVRVDPTLTSWDDYADGRSDQRSITSLVPRATSMVTSGAQMDSGLFEANLNDPRYLPFEGAGAISSWSLGLPKPEIAGFDYQSISDVVVHLRYSALPGGQRMANVVTTKIEQTLDMIATLGGEEGQVLIDVAAAFPTEWQAFISGDSSNVINIPIEAGFFPYQLRNETISISGVALHWVGADPGGSVVKPNSVDLGSLSGADTIDITVSSIPSGLSGLSVLIRYEVTGA